MKERRGRDPRVVVVESGDSRESVRDICVVGKRSIE